MFTVYLIEDDPAIQLGCSQALELADLPVQAFDRAELLLPVLQADQPCVVVTDMRLPGMDGLAAIEAISAIDPTIPVIMITGHGDVNLAVQAMRSGAYDFITKPFSSEHLVEVVQRALEKRRLTLEVNQLRRALSLREGLEGQLVGNSPAIQRIRALILDIADSPVDVLIKGETGTGKEVVARALHEHSSRSRSPYVALNCGGLPDSLLDSELFGHEQGAFTGAQKKRIGRIEHANGGTLFLDELESMPQGVQTKLLRVLQERSLERLGSNQGIPIDIRVVAATKDDLLARAQAGTFRADLVYRLNVINIQLPPLRERKEDIPLLLEHFMLLASSRYARPLPPVGKQQLSELMAYHWPGNVRELRNTADALVLGVTPPSQTGMGTGISTGTPLASVTTADSELSLAQRVEMYERQLIAQAFELHDGHIGLTAKQLQTPKTTLADKLKKYGINKLPRGNP